MTSETIILGIAGFFHNLFTVIWIGGLVMIVLTVLPAAKNSLENNKQVQQLMHGILKRHRVWVDQYYWTFNHWHHSGKDRPIFQWRHAI
ncbi:MAG: hypothetical protein K0B14_17165 [Anaerolineaceae bacterium]|nr:hypothetical protein [Anaerolineaceae bacterium]